MADARFQAVLVETEAELQRLRERVSAGTPTVHKDLSLIARSKMVRIGECNSHRIIHVYY